MIDKLKMAYHSQRHSAIKRNIEWHFTYDSWIDWWGEDIINRGIRKGQLVMARNGDQGPYHPDNVRKATTEENLKEAQKGKPAHNKNIPHSEETKQKMSISRKGRKNSLEAIEKTRQFHIGRKRSEETKQKMKDAWLRRKQNV